MSFLKNLLGGRVKDVVENVVDNVLDGGHNKGTAKTQTTTAKPTAKPTAQKVELTTTELVLQDVDGSQEGTNTIFDADGDTEYRVEQYYTVAPGFWDFDSGAGEVDVSYAYEPEAKTYEESKGWETDEPYVAIMFDNTAYEMIQQYNKNQTVKVGRTLQKVNHDMMKYKSAYSREDGRYIQYHFYRFDEEIHYHIQAFVPNKYKGTEVEQKVLAALDLMAVTYREEHIQE